MTEGRSKKIREILRSEIEGAVDPEIAAISDHARSRYGDSAVAVIFYGSCLRRGYQEDDVVDLYLIVDHYRQGSVPALSAILNWMLPPNVIYLETSYSDRIVRAKCAIISLADFERGVSGRWFHSYMWARFAQPSRLAYVKDAAVTERILVALEGAAMTMVREVAPLLSEPFSGDTLWCRALNETYRAELRAERPGRAEELVRGDLDRYNTMTAMLCENGILDRYEEAAPSEALYRPNGTGGNRLAWHSKWLLRRSLGKLLSVLRLVKAAFTFDNGAIYILWKIERHSGVTVALSDWQRRHPILASTSLFWRLYRKGAFK